MGIHAAHFATILIDIVLPTMLQFAVAPLHKLEATWLEYSVSLIGETSIHITTQALCVCVCTMFIYNSK